MMTQDSTTEIGGFNRPTLGLEFSRKEISGNILAAIWIIYVFYKKNQEDLDDWDPTEVYEVIPVGAPCSKNGGLES